ncbi:hypothetical protein L208DRAFT_1183323, partial [Tricholoma matsutake]
TSLTCASCSSVPGIWQCCDCWGCPLQCTVCCQEAHQSNPFHQLDDWTGGYFEPVWLSQVGVLLHIGHEVHPCP